MEVKEVLEIHLNSGCLIPGISGAALLKKELQPKIASMQIVDGYFQVKLKNDPNEYYIASGEVKFFVGCQKSQADSSQPSAPKRGPGRPSKKST